MDKKANYWEVGAKYQMLRQVTVQGKTGHFILNKGEMVELVEKSDRVLKCKVAKNRGRAFSIGTDVAIRAFKKLSAEEEAESLTAKDEYLLPGAMTVSGVNAQSEQSDSALYSKQLLIPAGELVKRGKPAKGQVTYAWGKFTFTVPVDGRQDLFIRGELKNSPNIVKNTSITLGIFILFLVVLAAIITSGGNFMTIIQVAIIGFFLAVVILGVWRLIRRSKSE